MGPDHEDLNGGFQSTSSSTERLSIDTDNPLQLLDKRETDRPIDSRRRQVHSKNPIQPLARQKRV